MGVDIGSSVSINIDETRLTAMLKAARPENEMALQRQQHHITRKLVNAHS